MASGAETAAMRRALELAVSPDAHTGPNPRVGAVILDAAGEVVGEGYHRGAGTAHAEVVALHHAGSRARSGTAVVTLEPCHHTGRTGPCTSALVDAGVVRVVFAQSDGDPVACGGADFLRGVGIDVEGEVLVYEALTVNPMWTFATTLQRPFVTWKFAASLDGRVAAADGSSQWITGEEAREDVHRLRASVDAIVVGTGTVLRDDPRLTVRLSAVDPVGRSSNHAPLRVVVGQRDIPPEARVRDDTAPSLLIADHDPLDVLRQLFALDVHHVLLEGGPTLSGAFVEASLVDRVVAYIAPVVLGDGANAINGAGTQSIDAALRLHLDSVDRLGDDIRLTATLRDPTTTYNSGQRTSPNTYESKN